MKRAATLLLGLAACGGSPAETREPACEVEARALSDHHLRAKGTHLEDALGRTVTLRGVNTGGRSKFAPFAPFDFASDGYQAALDAYLDRAASWGIDVLRVPFVWAAVEPVEGTDDEAFLKRYDALLDGAWARGMFTIVDFHQDVYADVFCGDGFPAWTVADPHPAPHHDCPSWGTEYLNDDGVRAAFDAFWADASPVRAAYEKLWDRMVLRYKDRPGVIGFEVLNEPSSGTANSDTWEATTLTDFYTRMAGRVHATAPDALVFFDATGVDAVGPATTLARPAGEGLVFAPHYYQFGPLVGAAGNPGSVRSALAKWAKKGVEWDVPVLLGEFGTSNAAPDTAEYLGSHFDALDALGMGGTQWEYSTATELWNSEDLSLTRADGTENPVAAAIVRPYARAVAGSAITVSFDSATRELEVRFVPSDGVSEIVVPERAYPKGYEASVTGACTDQSTAGRLYVQATKGASKVVVKVAPKG